MRPVKAMTICLSADQSQALGTIAAINGQPVSPVIRSAIAGTGCERHLRILSIGNRLPVEAEGFDKVKPGRFGVPLALIEHRLTRGSSIAALGKGPGPHW